MMVTVTFHISLESRVALAKHMGRADPPVGSVELEDWIRLVVRENLLHLRETDPAPSTLRIKRRKGRQHE